MDRREYLKLSHSLFLSATWNPLQLLLWPWTGMVPAGASSTWSRSQPLVWTIESSWATSCRNSMTSESFSDFPSLFYNKLSGTGSWYGHGHSGRWSLGRGLLPTQVLAYLFYSFVPRSKTSFPQEREVGREAGCILEPGRALHRTGHR